MKSIIKTLSIVSLLAVGLVQTSFSGNFAFPNGYWEGDGNNCWLNATLQCLFKAKPLHKAVMRVNNEDSFSCKITKNFIKLYKEVNGREPNEENISIYRTNLRKALESETKGEYRHLKLGEFHTPNAFLQKLLKQLDLVLPDITKLFNKQLNHSVGSNVPNNIPEIFVLNNEINSKFSGSRDVLKARNLTNKKNYEYKLFAMIISTGNHFYAYAKDFVDNKWRCYNCFPAARIDLVSVNIIQRIAVRDFENEGGKKALMLFYQKIDNSIKFDYSMIQDDNDEIQQFNEDMINDNNNETQKFNEDMINDNNNETQKFNKDMIS